MPWLPHNSECYGNLKPMLVLHVRPPQTKISTIICASSLHPASLCVICMCVCICLLTACDVVMRLFNNVVLTTRNAFQCVHSLILFPQQRVDIPSCNSICVTGAVSTTCAVANYNLSLSVSVCHIPGCCPSVCMPAAGEHVANNHCSVETL